MRYHIFDVPTPGVFLSYSRDDEAFVTALENTLKSHGCTVWRDVESLRAGDRWLVSSARGDYGRTMFRTRMVRKRKPIGFRRFGVDHCCRDQASDLHRVSRRHTTASYVGLDSGSSTSYTQ